MSKVEAPALSCSNCGVSLRVDPEASDARCAHCGAHTPVPPGMRAQARAHRAALEVELRRLSVAETFARGMASGAVDRLARVYVVVVAVLCGVFTLGMMAPGFGADPVVSYIAMGVFGGGLALSMGIFFLALRWSIRKDILAEESRAPVEPVLSADLASERVKGPCGSCGADVPFSLGAPTARCVYCGTTVIPTEAVRTQMQRLASFRATLQQGRTSRSFARDKAGSSAGRGLEWAMRRLTLFFPMIIGIALGNAWLRPPPPPPPALRRGQRPPPVDDTWQTMGAVALGGGVLLTLVLVIASALRERAAGPRRQERALAPLAGIYGARVRRDGTRASVEWLDAHWAGMTGPEILAVHNSDDGTPLERVAMTLTHRGMPVLLVLADASHLRRFDAFVAAYDPARAERAPTHAAHELRAAGLLVAIDPAGIHLTFPASDGRFCAPGTAAWMLDRAVALLAT